MTAGELFTMYRALWADTVSVGDTSVERRIRRWLATNAVAARKQPPKEVPGGMLWGRVNARIAASRVPFGGTFAITIVVPEIDSLVFYGQTSSRARPWITDFLRDSVFAVPVAIVAKSFAIDVTTAPSLDGFKRPSPRLNPCPPVPIVVDALPIVPDRDSTWQGEVWRGGFLDCAPPASPLADPKRSWARGSALSTTATTVTFRRSRDGRVTFAAQSVRNGVPVIVARGERVSTTSYGESFD